LRYNITFPALASGVLKIYTSPENTPVESVVLQAATESRGSMELHSGNYNISVTMEYQGSIKIWTDVVHISDNAITEAVVVPSDFTDYLSSYGNVDISFSIDKFTITDEGAGIFSNESPIILDKSTGDTRIISADSLIVLEWRVGDVVIGTRSIITLNPVLFPSGTYTLNLVFLKDGKYWLGSIRFEVIDGLSDEDDDPVINAKFEGDYIELEVNVPDEGEVLSYQWYMNSVDSNKGGTPIYGATGKYYEPPTNNPDVLFYYVTVSFIDGSIKVSQTFSVTVMPPPSVNAQRPFITAEPQDAVYIQNHVATHLTVTASVTDGGHLSYQWYKSSEDSNSYGELIAGSTGSTFVPPTNVRGVFYYYCEVTNTILVYDFTSPITSTTSTRSHTAQIAVGLSPITLSGVTVNTKTYDGTTTATISGSPVLSGIGGGDNVGINITSANFAHADAGASIPVVITYQLTGSDANKYFLTNPNLTGTITQAPGSGVTQPTVDSVTDSSITVIPVSLLDPTTGQDVEYAISTMNNANASILMWRWSTTFTGLNSSTTYFVYARSRSDQNYQAGNSRASGAITTLNP